MSYLKRLKRLPSLAFLVTLATGLFWTWFGLAESYFEFLKEPRDPGSVIHGMLESAVFGLPFIIIALVLWFRPVIGACVLIALGCAFGIWIKLSWNIQRLDWMVATLLIFCPVAFGIFTLVREKTRRPAAPIA